MAPWLHEVKHPSLVLTGENDGGCNPRLNKLIAEALPDSELVILPVLRHAILLEASDQVAPPVLDFLRRHNEAASSTRAFTEHCRRRRRIEPAASRCFIITPITAAMLLCPLLAQLRALVRGSYQHFGYFDFSGASLGQGPFAIALSARMPIFFCFARSRTWAPKSPGIPGHIIYRVKNCIKIITVHHCQCSFNRMCGETYETDLTCFFSLLVCLHCTTLSKDVHHILSSGYCMKLVEIKMISA